jgi:hypothetical protein
MPDCGNRKLNRFKFFKMNNKQLQLKTADGFFLIDTNSIVRVEASSNYSKLYFNDGKTMVTAKLLSWFEEKLKAESFTRMHRSHLVNNNYLHLHQPLGKTVALQNGNIIPVSRRRKKMVWQKLAAACLLFFLCCTAFSQNVGIGTNTPHASAVLDVVSNSKGLSIPSLTTAQRTAIASPKTGLFVFDTDRQTLCMYNGANWVYFQSSVEPNVTLPVEQVASDGQVGDHFGESVAISGNYAVVGASLATIGANDNQGCAYVFFYNGTTWAEQAKLTAADGAADDNFGKSVFISGDYVVVGAPFDNAGISSNQGSAYIFLRSGTNWSQQVKINASDGTAGDQFGTSVGINGNYIVVGANGDDVGANANEGSAYFFVRSGVSWTQQDHVVAPFGAAGDGFGASVAISGDFAVIAAPGDDVNGETLSGSAHFFHRIGTNWSHDQEEHFTGYPNPLFGSSVSISGNLVVVGAPGSVAGNLFGYAKVFYYNGTSWAVSALFPNGGFPTPGHSHFGISVGVNGNHAYVGADFFSVLPDNISCGKTYLFESPNGGVDWYFVRDVLDPLAAYANQFGYSVAIAANFCIAGTPYANGEKGKVLFLKL